MSEKEKTKRETKLVNHMQSKRGRGRGGDIMIHALILQCPSPLSVSSGARRRPLLQGNGGSRMGALALCPKRDNQHGVLLQGCVHGGLEHQIGETRTCWQVLRTHKKACCTSSSAPGNGGGYAAHKTPVLTSPSLLPANAQLGHGHVPLALPHWPQVRCRQGHILRPWQLSAPSCS